MNKSEDIKLLVSRFMEGETSLDEEKVLYRYFNSGEVDAELLPLKEMFCSLSLLNESEQKVESTEKRTRKIPMYKTLLGMVASIALLLAVGSMVWHVQQQDYCEAYVYGKHVTDQQQVMKEISGTLQDLHQNESTDVDNQLHDIFN
jgi:hypothetical protein